MPAHYVGWQLANSLFGPLLPQVGPLLSRGNSGQDVHIVVKLLPRVLVLMRPDLLLGLGALFELGRAPLVPSLVKETAFALVEGADLLLVLRCTQERTHIVQT